jgi:hypothetical protein
MAKKSKATKARTKKVVPTYLDSRASFTIGLHDVVRALKVIEKHKQLDKFVRAAKRKKALMSADANTVNFVKDFMVENKMHDDPVGKHIVNAKVAAAAVRGAARAAAAQDPFRPCNFGKGG